MSQHGRTHWIKIYVEMLDDPKIGLLPDAVKWRFTSVMLMAGELNEEGFLPAIDEMAWRLRIAPETLQSEMRMLAGRGLVELRIHDSGEERWFIAKFTDRQRPSSNAERQKEWRERNKRNATVTKSAAEVTPETEYRIQKQNTEAEAEAEAEKSSASADAAAAAFLKQFGLALNAKTAAIVGMDPEYIRGHLAYAQKRGDPTGLAIRRMIDGDLVPGMRLIDLENQIPPEYADIIQH